MSSSVKNIPKSQEEISNDRIVPNYPELGKAASGEFQRANSLSQRDDEIKNISVDLEYINNSVMYYFENIIKPTVTEDETRVKVPVIYASPERWKSTQKDGYFRDKNGQVLFPVIAVKRTNIERNRELGNKLDGNKVHNYQVFETRYTKDNMYDQFSALFNRKPVSQIHSVLIPDYYFITYTCGIWTSYMEDMNKIIESIAFYSDAYWGEPNKFKFKAKIDSFPTTQELLKGEDRKFSSEFDITFNGFIIPDNINRNLASNSKSFSKGVIKFQTEIQGMLPN